MRTLAPLWAKLLIETYFEDNIFHETTEKYKNMGLLCSQYWYHELKRILNSKLHTYDDSFNDIRPFMQPVLDNYVNTDAFKNQILDISKMIPRDKSFILRAFCNEIGIHPEIFPFKVEDIL